MLRCITNIDMRSYITTSHQNYYTPKRRATVWASRMLTAIPSNQATVGWHWLYIMKQSNKFTGWQHCTWLCKHLNHDLKILGPRLESKCCNKYHKIHVLLWHFSSNTYFTVQNMSKGQRSWDAQVLLHWYFPLLVIRVQHPSATFPHRGGRAFETITNIPCAWSTNSNLQWSLDTKHSQGNLLSYRASQYYSQVAGKPLQAILCILIKSMLVLTTAL